MMTSDQAIFVPNVVPTSDFMPWPLAGQGQDAGSMRLFWRKERGTRDQARGPGRPNGVVNCPSRPSGDVGPGGFLDDEDWGQIYDLLSSDSGPSFERSRSAVASSLAELRASLHSQIMPSGPVLDRLLDIWALVHQVDPHAARPVECLLSSLVDRELVSAKEVSDTCEEVETALEGRPGRAAEDAHDQVPRQIPSKGTSIS
jgi:hypothetical protein